MEKSVFLDHAATTPLDSNVARFLRESLGEPLNPSSVHRLGQRARASLEEDRIELARLIGMLPEHVVFTSGATEANNLALRGLAAGLRSRLGRTARVACSALEHSCIRETVRILGSGGEIELLSLPVSPNGLAQLDGLQSPKGMEIDILCLMAVQNETGVIQALDAARAWKARHPEGIWLCDATQAVGLLDVRCLGADLISFSSHKVYGPPGVGVLAGPGIQQVIPQMTGGPQEHERRAGTQPVALIRAFVRAMRIASEQRIRRRAHLESLETGLLAVLGGQGVSYLHNGGESHRLPGFLNLSFPGLTGADLVIALDARGFAVSAGSACATGVMETSPALAAMFPDDPARAAGGLRITAGKDTTLGEMAALAETLGAVTAKLKRSL